MGLLRALLLFLRLADEAREPAVWPCMDAFVCLLPACETHQPHQDILQACVSLTLQITATQLGCLVILSWALTSQERCLTVALQPSLEASFLILKCFTFSSSASQTHQPSSHPTGVCKHDCTGLRHEAWRLGHLQPCLKWLLLFLLRLVYLYEALGGQACVSGSSHQPSACQR